MTEVGTHASMHPIISIPSCFFLYEFEDSCIACRIVIILFADRVFFCPFKQFQSEIYRIFARSFSYFIQKGLFSHCDKVRSGCSPCSCRDISVTINIFCQVVIDSSSRIAICKHWAPWQSCPSDMKGRKITICVDSSSI